MGSIRREFISLHELSKVLKFSINQTWAWLNEKGIQHHMVGKAQGNTNKRVFRRIRREIVAPLIPTDRMPMDFLQPVKEPVRATPGTSARELIDDIDARIVELSGQVDRLKALVLS